MTQPTSPLLTPMLTYADAPAAIDFLAKAFGFEELFRMQMPDGRIGHAEVGYDGLCVMLASEYPTLGLESPRGFDARYSQIHVYVDDVDAHHDRARNAGATIAAAPADQDHGDRMYRAMDPEGHRWIFSQRLEGSA